MSRQSTEDFWVCENTALDATVMVETRHHTCVQTHRTYNIKSGPKLTYELWELMMGQRRFTDCHKAITPVGC